MMDNIKSCLDTLFCRHRSTPRTGSYCKVKIEFYPEYSQSSPDHYTAFIFDLDKQSVLDFLTRFTLLLFDKIKV